MAAWFGPAGTSKTSSESSSSSSKKFPPGTRSRSVAIRWCHGVHATNFEARGEFHDSVALGEHGRPPDHGISIPSVRDGMNQTRWLDECIALCHLLREALARLLVIM